MRKGLPTVYITFEGFGKNGGSSEANTLKSRKLPSLEEEKYIWLQLHNNTHWVIVIPTTDMFITVGGVRVVHPRYQVEKEDGTRAPVNDVDRQEFTTLRPGRSAYFSVLRKHLANGLRIYINFSFKWDSSAGIGEPVHRVEFRGEVLPKDAR